MMDYDMETDNDYMGDEFFDELDNDFDGINFTDEQQERIREKLTSILDYEPKVGILGKTSVGKSSLCNALFGRDICEISDIEACTRETQEVLLDLGGNGLTLLDVPGFGESREKDREYEKLYKKLLPELDLILWVLKADDRAYTSDEMFYKNIAKQHIAKGKPFFFVLNQCDKIEPYKDWDDDNNVPGYRQEDNINQKIESVSEYFDVEPSKIIPVSANARYNLAELIDEIVQSLPRDKKIAFFKKIPEENRSDKSTATVRRSWYECVADTIVAVCDAIRDIVFKVLDNSGNAIERFFSKMFRL